ncbi:MAG: aminodeoxychorismate synthase component I [Pyrinomonadaceae bacterium MAG19_C2-C3]|nr:aminodeoxychorismate synthase component I [Pyrinomonadaceae bacterium MAG19_C2-C3]
MPTRHATQTCNVRELALDADTLVRALLSLDAARRPSLLDSCGYRTPNEARYLIAAFDPCETIEARGTSLLVQTFDTLPRVINHPSALEHLTARLAAYPSLQIADDVDAQPVRGGLCIATLSYKLATRFLDLRLNTSNAPPASDEPDAVFAFYDALIVHDYKLGRTILSTLAGEERLSRLAAELLDLAHKTHIVPLINSNAVQATHTAVSNFTSATYQTAVRRIKEHIFAGDIYQANLTQNFTCDLDNITTPEVVFKRLRQAHPASHAAFIRRRDDTVISISPERFLRVHRPHNGTRIITAAPIKGTRPRGKDAGDDARLRHELATSAKDRAENVMIVDLMRNDLGRVCEYASVKVTDLCRIEIHPTLFHLVSIVRGRLRTNVTTHELLQATFPSGSITGAPKLRAMEIIHAIEPHNRELSMGAIGFFAFDGTLDLSVAIRTMTIKNNRAQFATGGGITADSDPADEYAESLVKARALFKALGATLISG